MFNMDNRKKTKCSIKNCPNYRSPIGTENTCKRFFRFPRPEDVQRVQLWKFACSDEKIMKRDPSSLNLSSRVCSDHFQPCFMTGRILNRTAIPTLNLFLKPISVDVGTQTEKMELEENKNRSLISPIEEQMEILEDTKRPENDTRQIENAQVQTTQDISSRTPKENRLRNFIMYHDAVKQVFLVTCSQHTPDCSCFTCRQKRQSRALELGISKVGSLAEGIKVENSHLTSLQGNLGREKPA